MAERRRGWRWRAATSVTIAVVLGAAGCTSTPPGSATTPTVKAATSAVGSASSAGTDPGGTSAPAGSSATSATGELPATASAPAPPTSASPPATPPFTPAVDAEAVDGDCPYLPKDQVQADTGQRMGTTRVRPAEPQPVCEFVRSDGGFLATVRVLQLEADATAISAVDFYVPRDASNPESRPEGWAGGSLATDGGSMYGVSKGVYAVIAETNQKQSVYARLLAVHAIENLGL